MMKCFNSIQFWVFFVLSFLLQLMLLERLNLKGLMDHQVNFAIFSSRSSTINLFYSFHSIYEPITDHKNYWNEMSGNRWLPHCLPFFYISFFPQHCSPNWLFVWITDSFQIVDKWCKKEFWKYRNYATIYDHKNIIINHTF